MKSARKRKEDLDPDPTTQKIKAVQAAKAMEDLSEAMWPSDLSSGFSTEEQIYEHIQTILDEMVHSEQTHRDIAQSPDFSLRLLMPKPILSAVQAVSEKNGWHAETLMLCLMSNLMWLEHESTRLSPEPRPDGKTFLGPNEALGDEVSPPPPVSPSPKRRRKSRHCAESQELNFSQNTSHELITEHVTEALDKVLAKLDSEGQLEAHSYKQIRRILEDDMGMTEDTLLAAKQALKCAIDDRLAGAKATQARSPMSAPKAGEPEDRELAEASVNRNMAWQCFCLTRKALGPSGLVQVSRYTE